jgi:outer membrane protein
VSKRQRFSQLLRVSRHSTAPPFGCNVLTSLAFIIDGVVMKLALSCLLFLVCTPIAYGEGLQVGIVDTQEVLNLSIVGKAAKSNVEGEMKKGQAKLAQLKGDFEKSSADLSKQAAILSGSALEERKEALAKKRVEYERAAVDLREGIMRKNDVELGKVVKEIQSVVAEVADEKGFTFVLERDKQTVVYANEELNITAEVVKALDKRKVAL